MIHIRKVASLHKSHCSPGNHHAATSKDVLFPGHNHLLTPVLMTQHFAYHPRWHLDNNQYQVISTGG